MHTKILPYLYSIHVPLPGSPLKILNTYLIKTKERNLLIDTGFNRPECLDSLLQGLAELDVDMDKTDIFITHLHADHSGLVNKIASANSNIYMNPTDKDIITTGKQKFWDTSDSNFLKNGFPADELEGTKKINPARVLCVDEDFPIIPASDGDIVNAGNISLLCIHTPGHTPGHTCLYIEKDKVMIMGDHILFDITPNITYYPGHGNSLVNYLESLKKIQKYDVAVPLASHRANDGDFQGRIRELLAHHEERLNETFEIIKVHPDINCYDIASKMRWSIRAKGWDDFPLAQKWFAVGETIAHVKYLLEKGKIKETEKNGIYCYTL